jgi:type II secretory pathway pseudopilin PulG
MVALLVALNIMAIMLTMALPTWRQMVQREKEAELVFRGEQYRRAIGLYQRRQGPGTLPPSIDVLVEERFLRKAYKDPITGADFVILRQGQTGRGGQGGRGAQGDQGGRGAQSGRGQAQGRGQNPTGFTATVGNIIGVASASELPSIRLYNGRGFYNEWEFVYAQQGGAGAGGGGGGAAGRGGAPARGGGGDGRGVRGRGDRGQPPVDGRGRRGQPPDGRGRGQGGRGGGGFGGAQRGAFPQ